MTLCKSILPTLAIGPVDDGSPKGLIKRLTKVGPMSDKAGGFRKQECARYRGWLNALALGADRKSASQTPPGQLPGALGWLSVEARTLVRTDLKYASRSRSNSC